MILSLHGLRDGRASLRVVAAIIVAGGACALASLPASAIAERVPDSGAPQPAYDNTLAKDFIMDAPWRVVDANTPIPISIVIKDCDVDDVRELHWIRAWDVTGGGSTLLWDHNFGDERIGNDATEKKYWTYITTVTEGHASLPNGTLLTPANLGYGAGAAIQLKVSVYYRDDFFNYTENRYLRVHVGSGAFPWPAGWYGGDTHVHTMYTNNIAEFGAPIPATRRAAAAIGMHWMTITDHSCDLDETGDGTWSYATLQWEYTLQTPAGIVTFTRDNVALGGTWAAIGADVADFEGADLRLERGVEINLASIDSDSPGKTLHTLFVNPFYIDSPWCGTITERPVFPTLPNGLAQLAPGGFAFAAHPLSDLAAEFGGLDFAVNGARWGDQDVTVALGYEAFRGFQAFNTRDTRTSTNQENPWADFDAGVTPGNAYPSELLQGVALWDARLRANVGTAGSFAAPGVPPRKIFFAGGSDAHGDFNYATHLSTDTYATDNALGKVQTVVQVPGAFAGQYGPGNLPPADSLMAAYRAGRSVATDGPFLEIGLDRDNDGDWYEPGDLRIGDDGAANPSAALPLRVRWASLAEFGAITNVSVYAGNAGSTAALLSIDPASMGQGYAGATTLDLGAFALSGAVYVRAECLTTDGGAGHRAYTNPIWIAFDEATDVAGGGEGRDGDGAGDGAGDAGGDGRAPTPNGAPLWLGACAPNPFRAGGGSAVGAGSSSATVIPFALAREGRVTLAIYDTQGRRVRTLFADAPHAAGRHAAAWDGRDDAGALSSAGIYFVLLRGGTGEHATERLILLR